MAEVTDGVRNPGADCTQEHSEDERWETIHKPRNFVKQFLSFTAPQESLRCKAASHPRAAHPLFCHTIVRSAGAICILNPLYTLSTA